MVMNIEELQKSVIASTQSEEPVAIQTPTGNVVNGNSLLTGTNEPKDYKITLWLPIQNGVVPEGAEVVMNGTAYVQEVVAKQKFISAQVARKVRNYASIITMAFTKFEENGDSSLYTPEDIIKVYEIFDDNVINACEKMVTTVLGINDNLVQYITDTSLMDVCSQIIQNNPAFFQAN